MQNNTLQIAFIGGGNMASALISGIREKFETPVTIHVVDPNPTSLSKLVEQYHIEAHRSVSPNLAHVDVFFLAVKPQQLQEACESLKPILSSQLLISVAAGVLSKDISRWTGNHSTIVRCMPNTPAMIGMGATGLFALPNVSESERDLARSLLDAVGISLWVDEESKLDAVTAVSGSGPAYVFYFIEALTNAGIQLGLTTQQASQLALATFRGASELAYLSDDSVSELREKVTSKGGTTFAALSSMNDANVSKLVLAAVEAAALRAKELGEILGADKQ